jgi:hypothetical protein
MPDFVVHPFLDTPETRAIVDEALAELRGVRAADRPAPEPPGPPRIVATTFEDYPAQGGAYVSREAGGPLVMLDPRLEGPLLRQALRHELAHWWCDLAGLPIDEAIARAFARGAMHWGILDLDEDGRPRLEVVL